ncbi:MAG TPA: hypothetical protein VFS67_00180 [Polyangiaceae bacterium]|nr:hypothetical protein [Polyangiaceae bacterium]
MKYRLFSQASGRARMAAGVLALGGVALGCAGPAKVDVADSASNQLNGQSGFIDEDGDQAQNLDMAACLQEKSGAEQRKVALYMMLDSSGSMEESTGSIRTKWDSVQRALRGFLAETRDSDLLLGMQFFPLLKPGVKSFTCKSQSDCGDDGGPCFLSTCRNTSTIQLCRSNSDCPGGPSVNPCVDFGLCSGSDPAAPLACILGQNGSCGPGQGFCQDFDRTCTNATSCDPNRYGTPAVEIQPVTTGLVAIDQALMGKLPEGLTPTVPALTGSLEHARQWAIDHPDQTVATLLATDGLPTECGSAQQTTGTETINQVLNIAAQGANDDPPVRTFVIGVFRPGDDASINNVNAIAQAGGTQKAVFIDSTGEVEQQFLDALREIRSGQLACEFRIPQSEQQLDYFKVNLEFDDGSSTRQLKFVRDSGGCSDNPLGWHYDVDPNQRKPTSIQVCPNICQEVKAAAKGSINLQLGCATILR